MNVTVQIVPLNNPFVKFLVTSGCALQSLKLDGNKAGDLATMIVIKALQKNRPPLTDLGLSDNCITLKTMQVRPSLCNPQITYKKEAFSFARSTTGSVLTNQTLITQQQGGTPILLRAWQKTSLGNRLCIRANPYVGGIYLHVRYMDVRQQIRNQPKLRYQTSPNEGRGQHGRAHNPKIRMSIATSLPPYCLVGYSTGP